ncbi:MAG: GxxExxY protein [Novosphingobium sp.]|nr:GxxExxY protein [Novosphingobium sp.]
MTDPEELAAIAIDTAFQIHKDIGPGLLESAYEMILAEKLRSKGIQVDRQVPIDIKYDGIEVKEAYRIDLLLNHCLIIEVKAVEQTQPVHAKQVLTYLAFTGLTLGFVMNFGMGTFKDGLRRLVRNHSSSFASSRLRANHSDGAAG